MMTRRKALQKITQITAATAVLAPLAARPAAATPGAATAPGGIHTLPNLPYPYDALEPHIDAKTMEIHHDRHHATYISNLNRAVAGNQLLNQKPVEELIRNLDSLPENIRTAVRNNGGGHANHTLFWQIMKKGGGGEPEHQLADPLKRKFGSYAGFKDEFTKAALGVFGSGWAWLSMTADKEVRIETTPNQDSPLMSGRTPLLGLDVWEHAYYLKYQNKRADYIAAFFNVINWTYVEGRYRAATR